MTSLQKIKALALFVSTAFWSCSVLQNNGAVFQQSKSLPDTAYVYSLPYANGTSHYVVQGYYSFFSHRGDFAIDFKMKKATAVHAAREGVVMVLREDQTKGGVGKRFLGKENFITVKHSDGTYSHYLHLQYNGALVTVGDTVQKGQLIGLSGSTGFSAFPHLHFEVTGGVQKARAEIPVRFHTEKGILFLQPLRRYKAI
jgi:murein DD-endopeptidase MepM/ murein hydrolase activator NlpD